MKKNSPLRLVLCAFLLVSTERAFSQQLPTIPAGPADDSGPAMSVMPPELQSLHERNKETLAREGHIERPDQESRARYIENQMTARRATARLRGADENPTELGYYDLTNGNVADFSKLNFYPTLLPSVYVGSDSRSYLLVGGQSLKQLYTDTAFGKLIVDETKGAEASFFSPNLTIGGEPAVIADIRYSDNAWATAVYAKRNDRFFVVEADSRLEGERRADFVRMIEELVLRVVD